LSGLNLNLESAKLKERLVDSLEQLGFTFTSDQVCPPAYPTKESIREMYAAERRKSVIERRDWIDRIERRALPYFASGNEVNVNDIHPRLELVQSSFQAELFRYACLLWSIPISPGYGRRMRFLVLDESNNKLIGILGLSDPVYCLAVRDKWIQWNDSEKRLRLWHIMDAYVLGAVPPYNFLLGGKLVALLATTNEIRRHFVDKYANRPSSILRIVREPHLVLLTTASAMGRSSMLNRIKRNNELIWQSLGMTAGWGHFHLGNGLFEEITDFMRVKRPNVFSSYKFGGGPSWKLRVIRSCLQELGLPTDILQHGIRREVFAAPLAHNWKDFLRGSDASPSFYDRSITDITRFFCNRWLLPRAQRDQRYKQVSHEYIKQLVRVEI
jgi:hypothetical protein